MATPAAPAQDGGGSNVIRRQPSAHSTVSIGTAFAQGLASAAAMSFGHQSNGREPSGDDDAMSVSTRAELDRSLDGHTASLDHSTIQPMQPMPGMLSEFAGDTSSATLGRRIQPSISLSVPTRSAGASATSSPHSPSPLSTDLASSTTGKSSFTSPTEMLPPADGPGVVDHEVMSDGGASSTYITARRDPASARSGYTANPPPLSAIQVPQQTRSVSAESTAVAVADTDSSDAAAAEASLSPKSATSKPSSRSQSGSASAHGGTLRHSISQTSQLSGGTRHSSKSSAKRGLTLENGASSNAPSPSRTPGAPGSTTPGATANGEQQGQAATSPAPTAPAHVSSHSSRSTVRVTAPKLPSAPNVAPAPPPAMYWSRVPVHGTVSRRAFRAHTANLADEVMWLFGGCDSKGCFRDLWCFDTETMCWSKPKVSGDLPPPRRAHSATMIDRMLFVFGGGDGPHYFNDLYIFDTISLRWTKPVVYGQPPSPRRAHTANAYEGHMIIFGGGNGVGALNDVYSMDCSDLSRLEWKRWECKGKMPIGRGYHTSNVVDGKLIVIGGSDGHMSFNDIHVLKLDTRVWYQVKTDEIHNRLGHTATQVGSYLFVIGGHDSHSYTSEVLTLNLVNLQWEVRKVCGKKPPGRGYHQAWLRDSRLFVHGGFDGKEIYDDLYSIDLAACAYLPQITSFTVELEEE